MRFVIPSSKKKQYLSGSDWVINAIDYILKTETCAGNMSQIVMELRDNPNYILESHLNQFTKKFPVLQGSISRDYNLAPYWRIPEKSNIDISFNRYKSDKHAYYKLLEKFVNIPFENENKHLEFNLLEKDELQCSFTMKFDHRLFDAIGAEMFLSLLQQYIVENGDSGVAEDFNFTAPANLSDWMTKFYSGRNVNRKMLSLSQTTPVSLPLPMGKNNGFKFKLINFNLEETKTIYENAYTKAGYLMETPYLLSVVIHIFKEHCNSKGLPFDSCLIPVSINMRKNENSKKELFFNHVSYLFYQIHESKTSNLSELISEIKNQMYNQVKSGLPKDILNASLLTRIVPLPVFKKIFSIPAGGKIASFCFSHVGNSLYSDHDFMGIEIDNIYHMPRVPVPPGLGFFFNNFKGQLNLVISYLDGLLKEEDVLMFESRLRELLLTCQN